jgi:hypothetical protein
MLTAALGCPRVIRRSSYVATKTREPGVRHGEARRGAAALRPSERILTVYQGVPSAIWGIDHRLGARPRWGMTDSAATGADYFDDEPGPGAQVPAAPETVEHIADEIRDDIRLGHVVDDDVNHVLQERLDGAGISMRPEDVDTLADEIERDAST